MRLAKVLSSAALIALSACSEQRAASSSSAIRGPAHATVEPAPARASVEQTIAEPTPPSPPAVATTVLEERPDAAAGSLLSGRIYSTTRTQVRTKSIVLCPDGTISYSQRDKRQVGTYELDGKKVRARYGRNEEIYELGGGMLFLTLPGNLTLHFVKEANCRANDASTAP